VRFLEQAQPGAIVPAQITGHNGRELLGMAEAPRSRGPQEQAA
jgi:hypothetical protein